MILFVVDSGGFYFYFVFEIFLQIYHNFVVEAVKDNPQHKREGFIENKLLQIYLFEVKTVN